MKLTEQGLKDGLRDLAEVRRILADRRRRAEEHMSAAEIEVTKLRKLESYASIQGQELARQLAETTGEPPVHWSALYHLPLEHGARLADSAQRGTSFRNGADSYIGHARRNSERIRLDPI